MFMRDVLFEMRERRVANGEERDGGIEAARHHAT
jgi:hypothetical protein